MRNLISYLSIVLLVTAQFGCNNQDGDQKIIKSVSVGQIEYKILNRSFGTNVNTDATELDTSKGYYLQVDLAVYNNGSSVITFDTSFFNLTNDKGQLFPFSPGMEETMKNFEQSLNATSIESKTGKTGFIIFDVPTIANYKLQLNNGDWKNEKIEIELKPAE